MANIKMNKIKYKRWIACSKEKAVIDVKIKELEIAKQKVELKEKKLMVESYV